MRLHAPLEIITPTADGPVLSVLARADTSFTASQLARMLPYSREGLRLVLNRLTSQGIVLAESHGSSRSFRLNRAHLAAGPVRELAGFRTRLLGEMGVHVETWDEKPQYGAIFGSAARAEMTLTSDIDILVVRLADGLSEHEDDVWGVQLSEFADRVSAWTGNDARIVEFTVEQVTPAQPLLDDVAREGLTFYGEPWWFRQRVVSGSRR